MHLPVARRPLESDLSVAVRRFVTFAGHRSSEDVSLRLGSSVERLPVGARHPGRCDFRSTHPPPPPKSDRQRAVGTKDFCFRSKWISGADNDSVRSDGRAPDTVVSQINHGRRTPSFFGIYWTVNERISPPPPTFASTPIHVFAQHHLWTSSAVSRPWPNLQATEQIIAFSTITWPHTKSSDPEFGVYTPRW